MYYSGLEGISSGQVLDILTEVVRSGKVHRVSDFLRPVTELIGREYGDKLRELGKDLVKNGMQYSIMVVSPVPMRSFIMDYMGYKGEPSKPSPLLEEVKYIMQPIYTPFLSGAREEIDRVIDKVKPFLWATVAILLLVGFGVGFVVAKQTGKV